MWFGLISTPTAGRWNFPAGDDDAARPHTGDGLGSFGMLVFLVSLGMFFAASMVLYLIMRLRAEQWPPPGTPQLPGTLWLSTTCLVGVSLTMHRALTGVARGDRARFQAWWAAAVVLSLAFLFLQFEAWCELYTRGLQISVPNAFGWLFFALTGVHALHVLGGLVPLVWVTVNGLRGVYSRARHGGVRYCTLYWHFLDGVWLVMFVALYLTV